MTTHSRLALLAAFAVAFSPLTSVAQDSQAARTGPMGTRGLAALEKLEGRAFDVAWLSQAVAYAEGAVDAGRVYYGEGSRQEIKDAAWAVVVASRAEVERLTGWLKTWYGAEPDKDQVALMRADVLPTVNMATGRTMVDHDMNMSGDPDRAYLQGIVWHHEGGVALARLALRKATRPELKVYAQTMIDSQIKEVNQFQAWLKTGSK